MLGAHLNQIASSSVHQSPQLEALDWVAGSVATVPKIDAAPFVEDLLGSGGVGRGISWMPHPIHYVERLHYDAS